MPRRAKPAPFPERIKQHQLQWARAGGLDPALLEPDRPWVLHPHAADQNLYEPGWWSLLAGRQHRWARSLNSSQCFAVNLFAPFAAEPALARQVLSALVPGAAIPVDAAVQVDFEVILDGARGWLGERRQPTQVDVVFTVVHDGRPTGRLFVEVKFTETGPGECKGAVVGPRAANPAPERCLDLTGVRRDPGAACHLAKTEGRRYWSLVDGPDGVLSLDVLGEEAPCPFRHGLYQLMRLQALAAAAQRAEGLDWSALAVCVHPDNRAVWEMRETVAGTRDIPTAWAALQGGRPLTVLDPGALLAAAVAARPALLPWQRWCADRYALSVPAPPPPAVAPGDDPILLGALAQRYASPPAPPSGFWGRLKQGFAELLRRPAIRRASLPASTTRADLEAGGFEPFCRVGTGLLWLRGDDHAAEWALVIDGTYLFLDPAEDTTEPAADALAESASLLARIYVLALHGEHQIDAEASRAILTLGRYLNLTADQLRQAKRAALVGMVAPVVETEPDWPERLGVLAAALEAGETERRAVGLELFTVVVGCQLRAPEMSADAVATLRELADRLDLETNPARALLEAVEDARFAATLRAGELPTVPVPDVQLKPGEVGRAAMSVTVLQQKTLTTTRTVHAGTRVRVGGVPFYLGGSRPVRTRREVVEPVGTGTLIVTDRRILLVGTKLNYSLPLGRILRVDCLADAVQVHNEGARTGRFYTVDRPARLHALLEALIAR